MKQAQDGFIFLMTLGIILIISLLFITCLHHVLLYQKALNQQELYHQNFYQLENLAIQLAHTPQNTLCMIPENLANQVLQQLIHKQGCVLTIEKAIYRYLIEDLGDFPCLILIQQQQKQASHHLRISIMDITDEKRASILQIRFVKASPLMSCMGVEHIITSGVSSWRYLPSILKKQSF